MKEIYLVMRHYEGSIDRPVRAFWNHDEAYKFKENKNERLKKFARKDDYYYITWIFIK